MKKVLTAIVTFIFSLCLITATVASVSAASVKKVTNFKASATPIAVTLTWDKTSGAKGYEIQQKSGKKWKAVATIKKQKTTTYTVKKLKNGTTYQFRIRAVNGKKKGAYVTVKVKTGVQKIANVKATSAGLKSVKLTWDKANVTGYEIQQKNGKKWKTVKKIKKAKTTSLTVSKLPAAAKSTFRIRGYVSGSAKTYYGAYTTVSVTTAVTPMKNAAVKSVADTSVTIGWAKLSGVSGYQVQQLKSGKWVDLNKAVKNSVTQYTVKNLPAFTNQQFRVRAYQKDGKKTYYNSWVVINAKTKIGNVTGVTYSGLSANNPKYVKISWKAAGGAAGYRVMNGNTKLADVKTTYAELKTLNPGTAYKITVVPYNGGTAGNASSAVSFTTYCAQVTGVKVSNVTKNSATLSWNKTAGAAGYQLQYKKDGAWSSVINVTGTSYSFKDLASFEPYAFRVRAYNKNGSTTQYGAYSAEASATTKGLGSFANGTINWSSVAGATHYKVEYYNSATFKWEVAAENVTATSYNASEVYTDKTLLKVTAYKGGTKLETSNWASANISDVQFSFNQSKGIVTASWSKYDGASSYEVRIKSKGMLDGGAIVYTATDSKRSVTSKALTNGFDYEVSIVAVKGKDTVVLASFDVRAKAFNGTAATETEQLLYLVEAINRSKFDAASHVELKSKPQTVNRTTYIDMGFQGADNFIKRGAAHAFLSLMFTDIKGDCVTEDGFMKFKDATAIDSAFATKTPDGQIAEKMSEQITNPYNLTYGYTFENGKNALSSSSYKLDELIQPSGLAYLYNNRYDPNRISVNITGDEATGYHYDVVIKNSTTPEYHNGFLTGASLEDLADTGLGGMGNAQVDSVYGTTTIVADVDTNGKLTKYNIDSTYSHKIKIVISLAGANLADNSAESDALANIMKVFDDVIIEMNTHVEGSQKYEYTFKNRAE